MRYMLAGGLGAAIEPKARAGAVGGGPGARPERRADDQIVLTAADEDTALAVDVVPGQAHEAPHLQRLAT